MVTGKFTKIIDITASEYAPTIKINNPGVLKTDMKLTATLSCEQPYDIDDNLEDDVMSTFLQGRFNYSHRK